MEETEMAMSNWGIFLSSAGGLVAALGGFEFIKYLFNKTSNERIVAAQAFNEERKAIMEDYKRIQTEVDRMQSVIDDLRKRVSDLEETRLDLIKENNELKLALKEAQHNVCLRPDDECFKGRMPPREYCRLKKLANGRYDVYYEKEQLKQIEDDEENKNYKDRED